MRLKRILLKKTVTRIFICLLFLLSFFVYFAGASEFSIQAPATIYKGCVQPYIVQMDTAGVETKSIDSKLFLSGYFDFDNSYTEFSHAIASGNIYANYINGGVFTGLATHTGTANSGGTYQGWEYLYLNGFQGFDANDVSGDNLTIATLYLKANNLDTGHLDFYYVELRNGDDSNISSGINAGAGGTYTSYLDSLNSVENLNQAFSGATTCDSKPYISDAIYRQTGYISTSTGVQAVWTSVIAGPLYGGDTSREVWTKGDVELLLTGVSDAYTADGGLVQDNLSTGVKIDNTLVSAFNHNYISRVDTNAGWTHQYYEVLISGNVSTGFVGYENILGNTGSTYATGGNNYNDEFNIDVFWIDTVVPTKDGYFTGYISASGGVTTTYTLSGVNYDGAVSSPANGFHADWTYMDDQYKVISFSGTNPVNANCSELGYSETVTGYMEYLNTHASGYVRSGSNVFNLEHNIVFTNSFSGIVVVMDRAGNTGEWAIDISMEDNIVVGYGLIAYTEALGSRATKGLSGFMLKLAIYSGGFDKERLLGSGGFSELVYTGWIKTSTTGYAAFTGNFASGSYYVLAEGIDTLSYVISGVSLNPVGGLIDFGEYYSTGFSLGDVYGIRITSGVYHAGYSNVAGNGIQKNQTINGTDAANMVSMYLKWFEANYENNESGVYTGSLAPGFVDIPLSVDLSYNKVPYLDISSPDSGPGGYFYLKNHMQYHPFDLNVDGVVNGNDFTIIANKIVDGQEGATYEGRLNGHDGTKATMPF